ncbi:MAG: hypothetical protein GEV08_00965 [Acidimicrobiia bacterium]|nr:hypothetical protein [Acidimicrobiia bacterium]
MRETAVVSAPAEPLHTYSDSVRVDAPPAAVWELVTAMERYGEWSSENTGGYWRKGGDGVPGTGRVGDQFVGVNRRDGVEWKALVEVVERDEGRTFGFVTGGTELNFVLWKYILEPDGAGSRLTEYWELRNLSPVMVENGEAEVAYRMANMRESMRATLEGIKRTAEARTA